MQNALASAELTQLMGSRSFPPGKWNSKRPITGPRGPEDDPDFLRNL